MLSIPHMIVVFVLVLVIFGPEKLPELARGLGKLMAEFRKASTDFKGAFEQEIRDMERQAVVAERKKAADAAAAAAAAAPSEPATQATPVGTDTPPIATPAINPEGDSRAAEALVVTPVPESVSREAGSGNISGSAAVSSVSEVRTEPPTTVSAHPTHDSQQPA
jgi:TatA/E family protein of Tat protein translocase